ncbi:WD40-like Beta Propeller Repeat [Spirosomataceae bacterium TFI 002]|nr:WD40-like Beta Propeller Repeat [Spirosomataceae bacterium TFI 002]
MKKLLILTLISLFAHQSIAQSQYFGQNKPRYKKIDFEILQSPHFELYHYFEGKKEPNSILLNSEHWYNLHQEVFKLAFIKPNPLIIYKTHPDFQETTAIGGRIGEGTGGVTEGLRNRVVMPMMYSKRQTDHVLGHELVHAFQYQTMINGSDSTSLANIQNLPLFMVEGLAEYMSLGRNDSHTAMWMRDAVENNDLPSIEDLITKQYKYFPYRWGQAFWSYVTATYGDDIIRPLFKETAIYGIEAAFQRNFKMDLDRFSAKFQKELVDTYKPLKDGKSLEVIGQTLASEKNAGEMNVSPAISPDGSMIAYISSKNVLSLDIFIADANTGKTIRRIPSTSFGGHVDSYSFIETAGAWSPDSKNFAIVVQSKGNNKLVVVDIGNGNKKSFDIDGVESFTNPAWSPDGNSIVVSGLNNGISDLYQFNIKSKEVVNLTKDEYSDMQPEFSPDGRFIYFVSDRDPRSPRLEKANLGISRLDLATNKIISFDIFFGADNFNPQVSPDGNWVLFLSDRNGYRNLYKFNVTSNEIQELSNYYTGISGITMYSPAISISHENADVAYTYFFNGNYSIVKANLDDFKGVVVENKVDKIAGKLPPLSLLDGRDIVERNLGVAKLMPGVRESTFEDKKYEARFKLDYLANSGLGVSASRFGTGMGGGITGLFSDMLNNNQLSGTLALNGEIQDFGGQFYYLNQKRPFQFGASIAHIPYQFYDGNLNQDRFTILDTIAQSGNLQQVYAEQKLRISRLFIDQASVFAFKPLSTAKRLEFGLTLSRYSFKVREYGDIGIATTDGQIIYDYFPQQQSRNANVPKSELPQELQDLYRTSNINRLYAAYVGDNATFGTVAPLNGYRYRFQIGQAFGSTSFTEALIDARKYIYLKPLTIAGRIFYEGRLNPSNLDRVALLNPLSLAFPWYMHGLNGGGFRIQQGFNSPGAARFSGEQMALANFELRYPFTGPDQLALIKFNYVPSDINFFVDGGMVWSKQSTSGNPDRPLDFVNTVLKDPVISTGMSLRVNVLGYVILEPYFAIPFYDGKKQDMVTGINFMVAGW